VAPNSPISLSNLPAITSASRIGISWLPGVSDGGSPVLDYSIYFGLDSG